MKYKIKILSILFLAILSVACQKDDSIVPGNGTEGTFRTSFTVTIPGNSTITRSMDGLNEAKISAIDVLVFKSASSGEVLDQHVTIPASEINQSSSSTGKYEAKFMVELTEDPQASTIVLIANASSAVTLASTGSNVTKADFLDALSLGSSGKWNTSDTGSTPIPMYSEQAVTGLTSSTAISGLSLTRMLARIDIDNKATGFTLDEVYVVNYNTGGYIAPAFNVSDGTLLNTLPQQPMVPSTAGKHDGSQSSALRYDYPADGTSLAGDIYIYEAHGAYGNEGDATRREAACLVLKGQYAGEDYFYRVDFTDYLDGAGKKPGQTGFDPSGVTYIPVYRNHRYSFEITAAGGPGYKTFDEAVKSMTVLSNLKCTLHVVDETVNHMVFNGQHYLGIESKEYRYCLWKYMPTMYIYDTEDFVVKTNAEGGWMATIQDADNRKWLRFDTAGSAITFTGTVNDKILPLIFFPAEPAAPDEEATIVITAGRISLEVVVVKECYAKLFAKSNIVYKDGVLKFAAREEDNTEIPANSQGLHFKFGSLIGINCNASADSTLFQLSHIVYKPAEYTGSPTAWDNIPYYDFTNYTNTFDDQFILNFPATGYNAPAAMGDVCRYISDKGWVEGRWKTPSRNELTKLSQVMVQRRDTDKTLELQAVSNYPSGTYGTAQIENGWWIGCEHTTSKTNPPGTTLFLPAAGQRNMSNGSLISHGMRGAYWSSGTVQGTWSPTDPNVGGGGSMYTNADRDLYSFGWMNRFHGLSVRCIRDWENE